MTAKEVNNQLALQYEDRAGSKEFVRDTGHQVKEKTTSEGIKCRTEFDFQFKAPKLQFLLNNSNSAQVYFPIKRGICKYAMKFKGEDQWHVVDKGSVEESDGAYVRGDVPLSTLQDTVSMQQDVVVKLNKGSFTAHKFEAAVRIPYMRNALTSYFTSLKDGYELYRLGTLDLSKVTVLSELTPTAFKFNVCHTPSDRDLLQLFIATTGKPQSETSLYLQEPIPSLYHSSLIVSSEIFFRAILPTCIGSGGDIGLALSANEPQNNLNKDKAWTASVTKGTICATYKPIVVREESHADPYGSVTFVKYWVCVPNDTATLDLSGMKFKCDTDEFNLEVVFNMEKKDYMFKYGSQFQDCDIFNKCTPWSSINYDNLSLPVNVGTKAHLSITVSGTGQNQHILIKPSEPDVDITGKLERPAACKCDHRELQRSFLKRLRTTMHPKLTKMFHIEFTPVSIFALKNILFPGKNTVDMKEAALPGDLVVFGDFTEPIQYSLHGGPTCSRPMYVNSYLGPEVLQSNRGMIIKILLLYIVICIFLMFIQ